MSTPASSLPPAPGAIVLGLERIQALLSRLGSPHLKFPIIHVAGTNAKGSTTAYLDALLTRAVGLRTGRYNSPKLVTERDTCSLQGGADIMPIDIWTDASDRVKAANEDGTQMLGCTPFEILTATAFQAFDLLDSALRPEILIVEVGLGGALDATNIFPPRNVVASVICPVDLDHQSLLGNSLAEIAAAKAGIIKAGGLCVLADQRRDQAFEQASAWSQEADVQDDVALRASTGVSSTEVEARALGQAAATIVDTVARVCAFPPGSGTSKTATARLVRSWTPFHQLSMPPSQIKPRVATTSSWEVHVPARLRTTPTLCTPEAALRRYDDEDDFADGSHGEAVKQALGRLKDTDLIPDPAIHPEAYDEPIEEDEADESAARSTGTTLRHPSTASSLLQSCPSYDVVLPATRAALSAASTAVSTLHAIARDLPTLTPGSAQRDRHSFDPWEELRLRIAYGLTTNKVQAALDGGVRWRGRCEWVKIGTTGAQEAPWVLETVLLDGAHNPSSANALRWYLDTCISARVRAWQLHRQGHSADGATSVASPRVEITWIMAFSKGKDIRGMLTTLLDAPDQASEGRQGVNGLAQQLSSRLDLATSAAVHDEPSVQLHQRVGMCPFATPVEGMPWVQPADPTECAQVARDVLGQPGADVVELPSLEAALAWASSGVAADSEEVLRVTVICGSLYLVGECYSLAEAGRWRIEPS